MSAAAPRSGRRGGGTRWLRDLADDLARAGVAVRCASASCGVLRLDLTAPGALTVDVAPREAGRAYFRETRRFGVSYRGSRPLSPDEEAALVRIVETLERHEGVLPAVLEAPMAVGEPRGQTEGGAPEHTIEYARDEAGRLVSSEILLRLTSRCNQDCPFCSAPPPHAEPSLERVIAFLEETLPRLPFPMVTLTGGEPAIWPHLRELVHRALGLALAPRVRVQTNAVAFSRRHALDGWPRSDRLSFFVSLHAVDERLYDLCTGSRGQLQRAIRGTRNLAAHGVPVVLNLVATSFNVDHILDWVRAIPVLFPPPGTPAIHFSIAMCPEHRRRAPECLVRYTELAPRLEEAAALAKSLGVECEPLLASSHAAIPPCLLDEEYRVRPAATGMGGPTLPVQRREEVGVETLDRPWVKSRACARCSEDAFCMGLPRPYAARFGLGELRPIAAGRSGR